MFCSFRTKTPRGDHRTLSDSTPPILLRLALTADYGGGKRWAVINLSGSCFVERSAKLFDKGACRLQVGKAPTIIALLVSLNGASKSGRDAARVMKTNNLAVQFDVQSIRGDRYLDNKGAFPLVDARLTGAIKSGRRFVFNKPVRHGGTFTRRWVFDCVDYLEDTASLLSKPQRRNG